MTTLLWCVTDQNGVPQLETARRQRMISLSVWIDEVGRNREKRDWEYWVREGYDCRQSELVLVDMERT